MSHISNVNMWGGHPDRNYYVFVVLSVVFGFFGLDHFYLRSFETGFKKLVVNVFGLGLWYVWDVIQVLTDGAKIREEGLTSPLDWIRGIGRGTFTNQTGGEYTARKSYLLYAFLAIFLGCFGLDKFYMGQAWQGIAKLLSCFNIFLFLFGWLWVLWDSFHAFFMTKSILDGGIAPPMPYNFIFDPIPSNVFMVDTTYGSKSTESAESGNLLDWIAKTFGFPPVPTFTSAKQAYKDIVAPLLTVPVIKTLQSVAMPTIPGMPAMPAMPAIPGMPAMPSVAMPAMPSVAIPAMPTIPNPAKAVQSGGAASVGPGPVIAGALTAVVLAGGLKGFYDLISAQYG